MYKRQTTECVTASCLTPKSYARSGSIGVPFPDTYYKIVKPGTSEELPANTDGEICISGPTVMPVSYTHLDVYKRQGFVIHGVGIAGCGDGGIQEIVRPGIIFKMCIRDRPEPIRPDDLIPLFHWSKIPRRDIPVFFSTS